MVNLGLRKVKHLEFLKTRYVFAFNVFENQKDQGPQVFVILLGVVVLSS